MKQIICDNLTLKYESKIIVENLSFSVEKGDYLCVVGENGSGKTTLIRTLLGLHAPAAGSLEFSDGLSRRDMGYLPQQTDVQKDFPASVKEIVLSGCQSRAGIRPWYNKEEKQLAYMSMQRMNIENLAGSCYRELSGGQQQRVLLARAFCAASKMMILDEPVTGLDPMAAAEMYNLVSRLNEEGMTVIMISHDVQEALQRATHILHLGKKTFFGTREEYIVREKAELSVAAEKGVFK